MQCYYSAPPIGKPCIAMSVCVCVCAFVCPRSYLRNYTSNLHKIFMPVTYGPGSVLFWRCSDMLRISGFLDDVIFVHKPRLLDVAVRLRQWGSHAALGLARRNTCCRQRTLGTNYCSQGLLNRSGRFKYFLSFFGVFWPRLDAYYFWFPVQFSYRAWLAIVPSHIIASKNRWILLVFLTSLFE